MHRVISTVGNKLVICMASDTVYGLFASARSPKAVKRLYEVKVREGKPGTIIAASVEQFKAVLRAHGSNLRYSAQ